MKDRVFIKTKADMVYQTDLDEVDKLESLGIDCEEPETRIINYGFFLDEIRSINEVKLSSKCQVNFKNDDSATVYVPFKDMERILEEQDAHVYNYR